MKWEAQKLSNSVKLDTVFRALLCLVWIWCQKTVWTTQEHTGCHQKVWGHTKIITTTKLYVFGELEKALDIESGNPLHCIDSCIEHWLKWWRMQLAWTKGSLGVTKCKKQCRYSCFADCFLCGSLIHCVKLFSLLSIGYDLLITTCFSHSLIRHCLMPSIKRLSLYLKEFHFTVGVWQMHWRL